MPWLVVSLLLFHASLALADFYPMILLLHLYLPPHNIRPVLMLLPPPLLTIHLWGALEPCRNHIADEGLQCQTRHRIVFFPDTVKLKLFHKHLCQNLINKVSHWCCSSQKMLKFPTNWSILATADINQFINLLKCHGNVCDVYITWRFYYYFVFCLWQSFTYILVTKKHIRYEQFNYTYVWECLQSVRLYWNEIITV